VLSLLLFVFVLQRSCFTPAVCVAEILFYFWLIVFVLQRSCFTPAVCVSVAEILFYLWLIVFVLQRSCFTPAFCVCFAEILFHSCCLCLCCRNPVLLLADCVQLLQTDEEQLQYQLWSGWLWEDVGLKYPCQHIFVQY
jgi:hypothetical protein